MKYCTNCGIKIKEGDKFCEKCDKRSYISSTVSSSASHTDFKKIKLEQLWHEQRKLPFYKKEWFSPAIAALAIGLVGVVFIYASSHSQTQLDNTPPTSIAGVVSATPLVSPIAPSNPDVSKFICPENYQDSKTRDAALQKFITDYIAKNPNATTADLESYRYSLLVENNCQKTLEYMKSSPQAQSLPSPTQTITTPCNGTNYKACPAGQDFICPADGSAAYCRPPSQPKTQSDSTKTNDNLSPSLIKLIEPVIVEVNCYNTKDLSFRSMGSGLSYKFNGVVHIITNFHIYAGAIIGAQMPECFAVYPEPPNFQSNGNYGDYLLALVGSAYNPNTYQDLAVFKIGLPVPSTSVLNNIPAINDTPIFGEDCSDVNVGDEVTVFGYPKSGNLLGISETVTHGIISGIISGPIYKTDAPIDHGNSGGLAILNKNNCVLGIPTLGESGLTAGIGYIQSYSLAGKLAK